jgi:hypothetical protein
MLNKFPPDQGYSFASNGKSLQVLDATGRKVFQGDIPLKTMDMKTFADLTNAGQMATPGISSGAVSSDAMAGVADAAKSVGQAATDVGSTVDAAANVATKAADAATSAPYGAGMSPEYLQRVIDAGGKSGVRFKIRPEDAQAALDWQAQNGGQAASAAANAASTAGKAAGYSADYLQKVINGELPRPMLSKEKAAELLKGMSSESIAKIGTALSEGQVYLVLNRVCKLNDSMLSEGRLVEGPMDAIKGAAGKAMNWAATKGKNLTTKVTADKLNSAWQKAGSPTDSEELKAFLTKQGVAANVIDGVYKSLSIAAGPEKGKAAAGASMDFEQVKKLVSSLPTDRKARLLKYLEKSAGKAAPAAPSRDAGDGRIEPTMA